MDRKPVIVYCTPSLYIPGGIERVLTTKANYLADVAGYTVYIILTDGQDKSPYYPLSSQIRLMPCQRALSLKSYGICLCTKK